MNGDQPITRRDFEELLRFIGGRFDQIDERFTQVYTRFDQIDARFDQIDERFDRQEEKNMEFSRQIETNLLTAFHSYARAQQTRLHTVETIDNELRLRMNFLEDRILALETRHPLPPTPFPPTTR